jgi:hypothetical protein
MSYWAIKETIKGREKFTDVCFTAESWNQIFDILMGHFEQKHKVTEVVISEATQRAYNFDDVKPHRVLAAWHEGMFHQIKVSTQKFSVEIDGIKAEAVKLRPVMETQTSLY